MTESDKLILNLIKGGYDNHKDAFGKILEFFIKENYPEIQKELNILKSLGLKIGRFYTKKNIVECEFSMEDLIGQRDVYYPMNNLDEFIDETTESINIFKKLEDTLSTIKGKIDFHSGSTDGILKYEIY